MSDIDQYLDAAKARIGTKSDRRLSELIGKTNTSVNSYRTRRAWPEPDTMLKIAALAGMDAEQALIDLNIWKTEGHTRAVYQEIARKLAKTAAVLALGFTLSLLNQFSTNTAQAQPADMPGTCSSPNYTLCE